MTKFGEVARNIDQLRQQLSTIDSEIDRAENEQRRWVDEVKSRIRTLRNSMRDALEFIDELRQTVSHVQREEGYGPQQQVGLNAQQLAWELTQTIQRNLQQGPSFMPGNAPAGPRPTAQT